MQEDTELVDVEVSVISRETGKAFKVIMVDGRIWWLPKSQISGPEDFKEGLRNQTMRISKWIYGQKVEQDEEAEQQPPFHDPKPIEAPGECPF